ncbi:putative ribonuclease H-like domain-containing protein [Tanacetum coccineum]
MTDYSLMGRNQEWEKRAEENCWNSLNRSNEPTTAKETRIERNEMKESSITLYDGTSKQDQLKFPLIYQMQSCLMRLKRKCMIGNKGSKSTKTYIQLEIQGEVEIETISLDDLYNNLKIYEPELTGSSSTSQNSQNVAFVSSSTNNTNNTNKADNIAHGVTTAAPPAVESFVNLTDKSRPDKGYQSVPPPLSGNFIPRKPDLTFIDEIVESENLDVTTVVTPCNDKTVENKGVSNTVESNAVRMNNTSAPIIKDWNFDNESEVEPNDRTVRPSTEKIKSVKTVRETDAPKQNKHHPRGNQRNWNNLMSQRLGILTKSGKLSTAGATVNTIRSVNTANTKAVNTIRSVNIAASKPIVNHPKTKINSFKRGYSQSSRLFNRHFANKNNIININVNTARVKHTTARDRAVVSENKGKWANVVKASACWVWKAKNSSALTTFKKYSYIDSRGRSKHMIGNMCYLDEYEDYDGGFVSFGDGKGIISVPRKDNIYSVDLKSVVPTGGLTCLIAKATIDESNTWHRRLGHINFKTMNKLMKGNLVKVVTDDFSTFSWVFFLTTKDETSGILKTFITKIENQLDHKVKVIRSDNGTEFKNSIMNQFCEIKGIKREFSMARTPQQNGVAERKNRTLIKVARTMLVDSKLPTTFWAKAVNNVCYVLNRDLVIKPHNKTPYELIRGRLPLIDFNETFCSGLGGGLGDRGGGSWNRWESRVAMCQGGQAQKEKEPEQEYILIPLCTTDPLFSQGPKDCEWDARMKPTEVDENEASDKSGKHDQEARINTAGPSVSTANETEEQLFERFSPFKNAFTLSPVPNMTSMDNTRIFGNAYDDEDLEEEVDMNNVISSYSVPDTSFTKFHKDHPEDQVIGSLKTPVQTRHMTKITEEHVDEGYFVGYSVVSKAMRVFNKRTRIVEETLNIRFLKNTTNVKGNEPDWLFDVDSLTISMNYMPVAVGNKTNGIAGTKDNIVAGQAQKEKEPEQEYILIPLCTTDPLISQGPKDCERDAGMKPTEVDENEASDKSRKHDQEARSESERVNKKEMQTEHTNSSNGINIVSTLVSTDGPSFDTAVQSTLVNTVGPSVSTAN